MVPMMKPLTSSNAMFCAAAAQLLLERAPHGRVIQGGDGDQHGQDGQDACGDDQPEGKVDELRDPGAGCCLGLFRRVLGVGGLAVRGLAKLGLPVLRRVLSVLWLAVLRCAALSGLPVLRRVLAVLRSAVVWPYWGAFCPYCGAFCPYWGAGGVPGRTAGCLPELWGALAVLGRVLAVAGRLVAWLAAGPARWSGVLECGTGGLLMSGPLRVESESATGSTPALPPAWFTSHRTPGGCCGGSFRRGIPKARQPAETLPAGACPAIEMQSAPPGGTGQARPRDRGEPCLRVGHPHQHGGRGTDQEARASSRPGPRRSWR